MSDASAHCNYNYASNTNLLSLENTLVPCCLYSDETNFATFVKVLLLKVPAHKAWSTSANAVLFIEAAIQLYMRRRSEVRLAAVRGVTPLLSCYVCYSVNPKVADRSTIANYRGIQNRYNN